MSIDHVSSRAAHLDDAGDDATRLHEHWRLLRLLARLLVDGGGQRKDGALLSNGVHVQHSCVARGKDGLVLE